MATTVPGPGGGLLDLEKELNCSICTELLYQPLTLIDCLHTYCGSCLKIWFSWQFDKAVKSRAADRGNSNPYTCPSCRASVIDARPHAKVTTLLDMFLAANPGMAKSAQEKQEIAEAYRPGENILPQVEKTRRSGRRARQEEAEEERDRRLLEEVRERSLRETHVASEQDASRLAEPSTAHESSREISRERRQREERRERRREQERRDRRRRVEEAEAALALDTVPPPITEALPLSGPPTSSPRHPDAVEARQRERQIAHQSSLRSLMSGSESGTGTGDSLNEERILQQILDEGLLDNIDLHDLNAAQEDELSERIAEAYRQRHQGGDRNAPRPPTRTENSEAARSSETDGVLERQLEFEQRHYRGSRSAERASTVETRPAMGTTDSRHPPLSRPHLLGVVPSENPPPPAAPTGHRRRASDQSRRHTSPISRGQRREASVSDPVTRSSTDLSTRPQAAEVARTARPRQTEPRTSTVSGHPPRVSDLWDQEASESLRAHPPQSRQGESSTPSTNPNETSATSAINMVEPRRRKAHTTSETQHPSNRTFPLEIALAATSSSSSTSLPGSRAHTPPPASTTLYHEPLVNCARCARPSIQYQLYKHCPKCSMDLCLRCYRQKRGCEHWFGFGHASRIKFESSHPRNASGRAMQLPHVLVGRKYLRPAPESIQLSDVNQGATTNRSLMTTSDPARRLQEGKFCDRCHSLSSACFWACDYCNEGEWGFCNNCVNTHHCCTHPLLPIAQNKYVPKKQFSEPRNGMDVSVGAITSALSALQANPLPSTEGSRPSTAGSAQSQNFGESDYLAITFSTNCDICTRPIASFDTRLHCPSHATPTAQDPERKGDFDMCTNCFSNHVKTGQIRREDGSNGWRKCPAGHRMIVVGFEDLDRGQERVVNNDLVGGHRVTEEDMAAFSNAAATIVQSPSTAGKWSWKENSEGKRSSRAARSSLALSSSSVSSSSSYGAAASSSAAATTKFPPDGGFGKRCVALWSYYPEDGEAGQGELLFPKGAEIREVEEVNEDWYFGVYAGDMGVLPAQYVRIWS